MGFEEKVTIITPSRKGESKIFENQFIITEGNSPGEARNIGVEYVETPYVAFIDDDIHCPKPVLEKMFTYLNKYDVVGPIVIPPGGHLMLDDVGLLQVAETEESKWADAFNYHFFNKKEVGKVNDLPFACVIMKTETFKKVGKFNDWKTGEDLDWCVRAGKKNLTMYRCDAEVIHHHKLENKEQVLKRSFEWGQGLRKIHDKYKIYTNFTTMRNILSTIKLWFTCIETLPLGSKIYLIKKAFKDGYEQG